MQRLYRKRVSAPPSNVSRTKLMSGFPQSTTLFRDLRLGYDSVLRAKKLTINAGAILPEIT